MDKTGLIFIIMVGTDLKFIFNKLIWSNGLYIKLKIKKKK